MSFISLYFLLFLTIVVFLYYIIPKKHRWIVLLIASYVFYLLNDLKAIIFIIVTTITIYLSARKLKSYTYQQKNFLKIKMKLG